MERKSNRKKGRIELRAENKKALNRQRSIASLIVYPGFALFILGILLFDKTFITVQTQIHIFLAGAAIGIIINFFWQHKKFGIIATLFYGIFLGGPLPYCFVASTNFFIKTSSANLVELEIIETGNRSGRKSKCRTPYVVVEFQNVEKSIPFNCDFEKTITTYKSVTLTVSKGLWGFMVYTDKKLKD